MWASRRKNYLEERKQTWFAPNLRPRNSAGFSRLDLLAIVLMCAVIAVPLFCSAISRSAARAQRIGCANNLKQLGLSFKTWALDHGDKFPAGILSEPGKVEHPGEVLEAYRYFQALSNECSTPNVLICPADTRRPAMDLAHSFSNSNLSYFVGIDAADTNPQMFLTGDRNLTNGPLTPNRVLIINTNLPVGWSRSMHYPQGNIGFADGSVQQYSQSRLREALQHSTSTNRLVFP